MENFFLLILAIFEELGWRMANQSYDILAVLVAVSFFSFGMVRIFHLAKSL